MNQFYRDYLDEEVCRKGTNCFKWDRLELVYGRADLEAAWVADMDFRTVPAVKDALIARAEHAIYGYTDSQAEDRAAEIAWQKRRHDVDLEPDWILYSPGVVNSMFFSVRALTEPGEKVLIQTPVYGPFYSAVKATGRTLVENPLIETEDGWRMDFDDLEEKCASGVKLMLLCSPHNPLGRVWTREELTKLLEILNRHGVLLVSDEIHSDFVLCDHPHTRILSLPGSDRCVMLTSATKSFNLAGLNQSSCIVKDPEVRKKLSDEINQAHAGSPNIFGAVAQTAAYTYGDEWMDAVVEYIRENRDYAVEFIREKIPEIKTYPQEGTYLMWLDFRALGMTHAEISDMLVNQAHVAFSNGLDYGPAGEGHFRMGLASSRKVLTRILNNLEQAIRSR